MNPEEIENTLRRIAHSELGLDSDLSTRVLVGQHVGHFRTERNRQDFSTCYAIWSDAPALVINREHYSGHRFIKAEKGIPVRTGAMYRHFLRLFFAKNHFQPIQS